MGLQELKKLGYKTSKTAWHNKKNWYYENKNIAHKKAMELENNQECYYLITWTIYRDNNIEGDVSDFVLNNKSSVFSYFINDCEKKSILIKNAQDIEWNGEYIEGFVKWKDENSISYIKDDKYHLYKYQGKWTLGVNGVKIYKKLGNRIDNVIDLKMVLPTIV